MNKLIDTALAYSRTVMSTFVVVVLAGWTAYCEIPKESQPDVSIPNVYVSLVHEGISPEDAERLLVKPMETELRGIDGVKEMRSSSREGSASVTLEFEAGFDVDQALIDVRDKVDLAKAKLPSEAEEPTVHEVNLSEQPVIYINLISAMPERSLLRLARNLQDNIETLPGILEVNLRGEREELIEVIIDPTRLESYNIDQAQLIQTVLRNNRLVAAGTLDTGKGRFSVKVPGLFEDERDVLDLPVKIDGDSVVTLADVAEIRRTYKDRLTYARVDDKPSISIEVVKRTGQNLIETIEAVKEMVGVSQASWPPGVEVQYAFDQSIQLRDSLVSLQNSVISAILLVAIVVVAALGGRAAALVGVAVPTSFLFGFMVMWIMGITINQIILFGLILAVGLLVDGAIVVTEYADRKMADGLDRRQAYAQAAKRMAWPITASTATTLAAFLPLLFWPGLVGEFMWFLPLTLILVLTGSLLSALIFLPTMGAMMGKPSTSDTKVLHAVAAARRGDIEHMPGLTGKYARLLSRLIHQPFKVLLAALVVLVGTWMAYYFNNEGTEFFPASEPSWLILTVHARGNMSLDEKDVLVREVSDVLDDIPSIISISSTTFAAISGNRQAEDTIGRFTLELADWRDRPPAKEIITDIRRVTAHLAGIIVEPELPQQGPSSGKDIQIRLASRLPHLLGPAVERVRARMEDEMVGLADIEDDGAVPGIQWELKVDRAQASRFGADILTVGSAVQLVTNGIKVGEIRPDDSDDEIDIRIRYPLAERNIDQLDQLRVQTPNGMVPISGFVVRTARPKVSTIRRIDGRRVMTIQANVLDGFLPNTKIEEIRAWLPALELDPRIDIEFAGDDENQREAKEFLMKAFVIALFLMAIILITQFNSFYHALLILSAVVMSTVGVLMGLMITGRTFVVVMTGIGVISLAGIVVNNNIVLIDTFARLKKMGLPVFEAIVRTGTQRLRPVLLTTVTTVTGLMPMVFSTNIDLINRQIIVGDPQSMWWVDLSIAIVFGLSFATVLTLVVTPCLLAAPQVLREKIGEWRGHPVHRHEAPELPAE